MRIGTIFSELFPDERFNPVSSPARVRQQISRTRKWFAKYPVKIIESDGFYSLKLDGAFSFRVPLDHHRMDPMTLQFEKLKVAFQPTETFFGQDRESEIAPIKGDRPASLALGSRNKSD